MVHNTPSYSNTGRSLQIYCMPKEKTLFLTTNAILWNQFSLFQFETFAWVIFSLSLPRYWKSSQIRNYLKVHSRESYSIFVKEDAKEKTESTTKLAVFMFIGWCIYEYGLILSWQRGYAAFLSLPSFHYSL